MRNNLTLTPHPRSAVYVAEPFGVYMHWPFCRAKCPYCDFNSHVRHGGVDEARFLAAYLRELDHFASLAPRRSVTSIFFGGGTPSLMVAGTVTGTGTDGRNASAAAFSLATSPVWRASR